MGPVLLPGLLTGMVVALFLMFPISKAVLLEQGKPVEYWYVGGVGLALLWFIGLLCLVFLHREGVFGD